MTVAKIIGVAVILLFLAGTVIPSLLLWQASQSSCPLEDRYVFPSTHADLFPWQSNTEGLKGSWRLSKLKIAPATEGYATGVLVMGHVSLSVGGANQENQEFSWETQHCGWFSCSPSAETEVPIDVIVHPNQGVQVNVTSGSVFESWNLAMPFVNQSSVPLKQAIGSSKSLEISKRLDGKRFTLTAEWEAVLKCSSAKDGLFVLAIPSGIFFLVSAALTLILWDEGMSGSRSRRNTPRGKGDV